MCTDGAALDPQPSDHPILPKPRVTNFPISVIGRLGENMNEFARVSTLH